METSFVVSIIFGSLSLVFGLTAAIANCCRVAITEDAGDIERGETPYSSHPLYKEWKCQKRTTQIFTPLFLLFLFSSVVSLIVGLTAT